MGLFVPGSGSGGSSTAASGASIWTNGTDFWSYADDGTTKTWTKLTGAGAGTDTTSAPTDAVPVAGNAQRETVTARFTALTASVGFWSIGDTLQRVIVYDISATVRSVLLVAWFNETTGTALTTIPVVGTDVVEKEASGGGDLVLYTIGGTTWLPGRRTWVGEDSTLRSLASGAEVTTATGVASFIERNPVKYTVDAGVTILDGFEVTGIRDGQTTTSRLHVTDGDGTLVATPTVVVVEDYVGFASAAGTVPIALQRITDTATGTVTFRNTQTRAAVLVASLDRYFPGAVSDGLFGDSEPVLYSTDAQATWSQGTRRRVLNAATAPDQLDSVIYGNNGVLVTAAVTDVAVGVTKTPVSYTADSGVTILSGDQYTGFLNGGTTAVPTFVTTPAGTAVAGAVVVTTEDWVAYLVGDVRTPVSVQRIETAAGVVTWRHATNRTLYVAATDFDSHRPGTVTSDVPSHTEEVYYEDGGVWKAGFRTWLADGLGDFTPTLVSADNGAIVTTATAVATRVEFIPCSYYNDTDQTPLTGYQVIGILSAGSGGSELFVTAGDGTLVTGATVATFEDWVVYLTTDPSTPVAVDKITDIANGTVAWRNKIDRATTYVTTDFDRYFPGLITIAETQAVEFSQTSHVVSELAVADVKPANAKRRYIFIRNDGTALVWLRFDDVDATTATPAYPLNPGEYYETWPGLAPRARISAIADTDPGNLFIIES